MDLTLAGLMLDDHTNASKFRDIASQMVHIADSPHFNSILANGFDWGGSFAHQFGRRGIVVEHDMARPAALHGPGETYEIDESFDAPLLHAGGLQARPDKKYLEGEEEEEDGDEGA